MSYRPKIVPEQVIGPNSPGAISGDMSQATITSAVTILGALTLGSYAYSWSGGGTPTGNLAIQISNDYQLSPDGRTVLNAGTWNTVYVTLNGSSVVNAIPVSGNSGNGLVEWSTGAYAIRTQYTRSGGSGTLVATIVARVA